MVAPNSLSYLRNAEITDTGYHTQLFEVLVIWIKKKVDLLLWGSRALCPETWHSPGDVCWMEV